MMQKELAQAIRVNRKEGTECEAYSHTKSSEMQGVKPLTASNFQASLLRIGDWEWKSRLEGDLVAKLYFAKSKLAWEIIHEGLKSKIEIKFSDIWALKVACPKDLPGTLEITVCVEPQFFRESTPRPRRSTRWLATTDFTGGEASTLRKHILQCDPGIMDKHIENLLIRNHRLYLLSQENTANPERPCLEPWCSVPEIPKSSSHQNLYHSDDGSQFGTEQTGQSLPLHPMPTGTAAGGLNHHGASLGALPPSSVGDTAVATEEPSGVRDRSGSDMFSWEKFFQTTRATQPPFMSNGGIISGKGNHINNQINSGNSCCRVDYSSSTLALPDMIRRYPDDSATNQQIEPGNRPSNTDHGVLFPSSVPVSAAAITGEVLGRRPQLKKDMFNWKSFLQAPRETRRHSTVSNVNAGIMNTDTGNCIDNQINPWNLHSSSVDHSPSRMALREGLRRFPDGHSTTNHQQVNSWNQRSYSNGSQTFLQIVDPAGNLSPSNGDISLEGLALEQILQKLLSDDEEVDADSVAAEEGRLVSTVNSLSCLIGQAASAPSSQSSQANDIHQVAPPSQVINVAQSGSSSSDSDGDDWFHHWTMRGPTFS